MTVKNDKGVTPNIISIIKIFPRINSTTFHETTPCFAWGRARKEGVLSETPSPNLSHQGRGRLILNHSLPSVVFDPELRPEWGERWREGEIRNMFQKFYFSFVNLHSLFEQTTVSFFPNKRRFWHLGHFSPVGADQ